MVLEEATLGQEPTSSFSEQTPDSDIDPYANSDSPYSSLNNSAYITVRQKGAEPIQIPFDSIPRPILLPTSRSALAKAVQENVNLARQVLKRPVTQDEANAFAYHLGRGLRIASYGAPIGIACGSLVAYRTNGPDYRFPGWTPFREGGTLSPDRFGPLRGQMARTAWQVGRVTAYWTVGSVLGQMFFGAYAISASIASRWRDPRLVKFKDALLEQQKKGGPPRPGQVDESDGAKAGETAAMARQRREVQRRVDASKQRQEKRGPAADDASPTGGTFEQDFMQGQADTGLMDDAQLRQYDTRRQRADAGDAYEVANKEIQQTRRTTSNTAPVQSKSEGTQAGTGGSAWARIRQNAMSGEKNEAASSRNAPAGGDAFSFSQGDEYRQLARAEAQRDFDQRMERERQGKDFEDGSGGRRKW